MRFASSVLNAAYCKRRREIYPVTVVRKHEVARAGSR
jgi:hypothetical protein